MSSPHSRPELYAIGFPGEPPLGVVAARTIGEARGVLVARRVGTVEAHRLGHLPLTYAKPEYAEPVQDENQGQLFDGPAAPAAPTEPAV